METATLATGRSADVRMKLVIAGTELSIGQLGLDFLILDEPTAHAPGHADISLTIDGREQRWTVDLPEGIRIGKPHTPIARVA
ncbi:MAG: hypothetical protein HYR84_04575 [Planctomycetes bacterium]|nr:hypothetical protein [Planctomycetota bacterium]